MATPARLAVEVSAIDKRFAATLRGAEAQVVRFATRMEGIGRSIAAGFAIPAGLIATGVFRAFGDFDKAVTVGLSKVDVVTDELRSQVEAAAMVIAEELPISASQGAAAFGILAAAGLDASTSLAKIPTVAKFATAAQLSLDQSTDFLVGSLTSLGESTGQMDRFSDVLVKGANISTASVQGLAEALTTDAGAGLRLFGKDLEEGVAVLAAYAQANIKGADAGTKLFQLLRDLSTKAIENKQAFADANIEVFDAAGNMRHLADIVEDLERKLTGLSAEEKRVEISKLGLAEKSLQATLALIGFSGAIRTFDADLRQAGGTTDKVARFHVQNFNDQLTILRNRLVNAGIAIGKEFAPSLDVLLGPISSLLDHLRSFASILAELPKSAKDVAVGAAGIGTAISAAAIAFGVGARAIAALLVVVKELGVFALRHPFLVLAAEVGVLVTSMTKLPGAAAKTLAEIRSIRSESNSAADAVRDLWQAMDPGEESIAAVEQAIAATRRRIELQAVHARGLGGAPLGDAGRELLDLTKLRSLEARLRELKTAQNELNSEIAAAQMQVPYERWAAAMARASDGLRVNGDELEAAQTKLAAYRNLLLDLAPLMDDEDERFKSAKSQMADYTRVVEELTQKRQASAEASREETQKLRELGDAQEALKLKHLLGADQVSLLDEKYRLLEQTMLETAIAMRARGATDEEIITRTMGMRGELESLRGELLLSTSSWYTWAASMAQALSSTQALVFTFGELTFAAFKQLTAGIGESVAQALVYGESLSAGLADAAKRTAATFIAALIDMGVQLVVFAILNAVVGKTIFQSMVGTQAGRSFAGGFASVMEAVPFPLNIILAPIVASAAAVATRTGATAASFDSGGMTLGAGFAMLHPREVITPLDRVRDIFPAAERSMTLILDVDGREWTRYVMRNLPREARLKFGGGF